MNWKPRDASAIRRLLLLAAGAILVLAGVGLAALTEHGLIDYQLGAERHGGQVLDLGGDGLEDSQSGAMERVTGQVQVIEAPLDVQFNQQAVAPVLTRHVEMFQWHEVQAGGPPEYELDWEDHPIDSSHFQRPAGHDNPGQFPIQSAQFDAGKVRVGGFVLSSTILHALPGGELITPDMHRLPSNLGASFSVYQNYLITSANPSDPRLGDIRVSWEAVPLQVVTVVGKANGDILVPADHAADGKGYDVEVGDRDLVDIFSDLPVPPRFIWPRRVFSILLATLGVGLLFWYRRDRIDPTFALATGVLVVGAVVGVLWLGSDNGVAAVWIVLAVISAALATWRLRMKQREN